MITAARTASPMTYATSDGERPRSTQKGSPSAFPCRTKSSIASSPKPATASPTAAAISDSTSASAKSWATTRRRLAPSAVRTTISPVRVAVRAYTRMATFTDTTTSSRLRANRAARSSHAPAGPSMPMKAWVYGSTRGRRCPCVPGCAAALRRPMVASSAWARSSVAPSARRPNTRTSGPPPGACAAGSSRSGTQ